MSSSWTGTLKRRYGKFENPLPSDNTIAEFASFVQQDMRGGENYNFPVKMRHEHGVTPNVDNTAFALNSAIDSVTLNAQLDGATIMVVGNLAYDVIAKMMHGAKNGGHGGAAYFEPLDFKIMNLMEGGELYREGYLLYGPGTASAAAANIGVIHSNVSAADLDPGCTINITAASWAPGLWANMGGALVDIYQSDGSTLRESSVTVGAIDVDTHRIALSKTSSTATPAAGDVIVFKDARTKSCYGLQSILENAGALFGISAATYPQWKALTHAVGGQIDRASILALGGKLYRNGLRNGGKLFISGTAFADLSEEASELQRFNNNTDAVKQQGDKNLLYKTPAGNIEVAVHGFMKQGIAMFFGNGLVNRIGATDLTFTLPGTGQWFYQNLPSNAGGQFRIYSNQAPVITQPYRCAILTGIESTGDTDPA